MDDRMVDQALHSEETSFELSLRPTMLKTIYWAIINKTT